ncbi:SEC-C domain-containing protein, partial [Patescibacteria group bacterium]|nr:SEC-C domain-containing protein [Patescibacteria group bacterium]
GFKMFESLMWAIDDDIVHRIFKVQIQQQAPLPQQHLHAVTNRPEGEVSEDGNNNSKKNINKQGDSQAKLGRNDPCWCGSGKKFKKCHYPQLP